MKFRILVSISWFFYWNFYQNLCLLPAWKTPKWTPLWIHQLYD